MIDKIDSRAQHDVPSNGISTNEHTRRKGYTINKKKSFAPAHAIKAKTSEKKIIKPV